MCVEREWGVTSMMQCCLGGCYCQLEDVFATASGTALWLWQRGKFQERKNLHHVLGRPYSTPFVMLPLLLLLVLLLLLLLLVLVLLLLLLLLVLLQLPEFVWYRGTCAWSDRYVAEVEPMLLLQQYCYACYHSPKYSHLNATLAVLHACFSVSATCSDVPQYSTAHLSLSSVITCCSICTCLSINMLDKRIAGVSVLCVQVAVALKKRRSICCSKYCY
jgi:hypothetical protein